MRTVQCIQSAGSDNLLSLRVGRMGSWNQSFLILLERRPRLEWDQGIKYSDSCSIQSAKLTHLSRVGKRALVKSEYN
jgi:hypothetical protein